LELEKLQQEAMKPVDTESSLERFLHLADVIGVQTIANGSLDHLLTTAYGLPLVELKGLAHHPADQFKDLPRSQLLQKLLVLVKVQLLVRSVYQKLSHLSLR